MTEKYIEEVDTQQIGLLLKKGGSRFVKSQIYKDAIVKKSVIRMINSLK